MNKKLEPGSEYNKYDADGDGVVTDELATTERLRHLRLLMKKLTLKRTCVGLLCLACCCTPLVL